MGSVRPRTAYALGLAIAIALLAILGGPTVRATMDPKEPAQAMTVTVVLDKASYLFGDTVIANAIVYRTPGPANYTYTWTVRDSIARIVNTTSNGTARFAYLIPLNYSQDFLGLEATVEDGAGLTVTGRQDVSVSIAAMALRLDRGEFSPGDTITATYSVRSHVIVHPTYDYEVDDSTGT
ncbi:MAG: hypothetical protein ACREDF_02900, partial [Thermoplasmata archaeon]